MAKGHPRRDEADDKLDERVQSDNGTDNTEKRGQRKGAAKPKESQAAQRGLMEAFMKNGTSTSSEQPKGPLPTAESMNYAIASKPSDRGLPANLEVDPNYSRRKRQRTASPHNETPEPGINESSRTNTLERLREDTVNLSWREQLEAEANGSSSGAVEQPTNLLQYPSSAHGVVEKNMALSRQQFDHGCEADGSHHTSTNTVHSSPPVSGDRNPSGIEAGQSHTPPANDKAPRKMLRLNAKGKFSSPPSKKADAMPRVMQSEVRRRPRTGTKRGRELIVVLKYSSMGEKSLGQQIDEILSGTSRIRPQNLGLDGTVGRSKPAGPPKPTHPFFLGMQSSKPPSEEPSGAPQPTAKHTPPRKSAITPGKARFSTDRSNAPQDSIPAPSNFRSPALPRHLGAGEPPWPRREATHLRALSEKERTRLQAFERSEIARFDWRRKMKHTRMTIPPDEALMHILASQLSVRGVDSGARLPKRLLTTGDIMQERVRVELQCNFNHPALSPLFDSIRDTLTAFDLCEYDQQAWAHKYAPKDAAQVLQTGNEMASLREWLTGLTVNATDTGAQSSKPNDKVKKPRKRKRRGSDLDGFIVDGDGDGVESFDELSDSEGTKARMPGQKPSVVRPRKSESSKLANVLLLSGPSGSGKTAAVHAAAKELGFEVFEINPGTRRRGQDVVDKVGDMTENHLVQQAVAKQLEKEPATGDPAHTDDTKVEVESGRQGTMDSFFEATTQAKPKSKPAKPAFKGPEKKQPPPKPRNQKQSLILLEEVDILFEDDQGFWATVRALASVSKRPIIMTCNDENLVRIEEEALHGILRFSPPPVDLATDYLLLIAAKEGHILKRGAVQDLYVSKQHDLRASIMELDFWCQMAVGDRKGGLEWMFQRWPPGTDVDEQGRTLRVASENTYRSGMGWLGGGDVMVDSDHVGYSKYEELALQAWENWNLEPSRILEVDRSNADQCEPVTEPGNSRKHSLVELQFAEFATDSLSSMDVFCRVGMPESQRSIGHAPIDPTLPPIPEKEVRSFIEGHSLLQADPVIDFANTDAQAACHIAEQVPPFSSSDEADKQNVTKRILGHVEHDYLRGPKMESNITAALEPLASTPISALSTSSGMTLTSLDRPLNIIVADIAPYIRSIAAFDLRLEQERLQLSNMLSAGGSKGKLRKTRTARSALEGGRRETTRRERWFRGPAALNLTAVMDTAGKAWAGVGREEVEGLRAEEGIDSGRDGGDDDTMEE